MTMPPLLAACLWAVLYLPAVWTCPPEMKDHDFQVEFCEADVVFRGVPIRGMSAVSLTEDFRQIEDSTYTFNILKIFKDNTEKLATSMSIDVSRRYIQGDPCGSASFPDKAESFLVFARGTDYLTVPTCDHNWPWECLPINVTREMPYSCTSPRHTQPALRLVELRES